MGKKSPERDALQLTYNSIKGGAVGVDMGRNIWQSEHPVAMIRAVRAIVHGNNNVDQAFKLYKKLVNEESKTKKPQKNKSKNKPNNQNKSKNKPNNQNKSKNKPNNQNKSKNKPNNQNKPSS